MRILVPSAGAASSISVIKEARRRKHFVLATDLNANAPGMFLANARCVSGMCYEAPYVNDIIEMCKRYLVEWIIPVNDVELPIYAQQRQVFADAGIALLMNPCDCVMAGHNKERSWHVCESFGLRQPVRYFQDAMLWEKLSNQMPPGPCYPIIAKPCIGVGGRGQIVCQSPADIRRLVASSDPVKLSHYMWQEYIYGEEYSVDCWGDPNSDKFVAVPRTREKVINGQATGGVTRCDSDVIAFVRDICRAFGSDNVCCVQVMRSSGDGALYFIEFNPRYGTGVSLSFEAGVNFLDLQFRQACGYAITDEMLTFETGVGMVRYWQERFYRNAKEVRECPPQGITLTDGRTKA